MMKMNLNGLFVYFVEVIISSRRANHFLLLSPNHLIRKELFCFVSFCLGFFFSIENILVKIFNRIYSTTKTKEIHRKMREMRKFCLIKQKRKRRFNNRLHHRTALLDICMYRKMHEPIAHTN